MINFDSLTLKAQLNEIIPLLQGGRVQKVQQSSRRELVFSIRSSGKSYKFYTSIHPSFAHCALLSPKGESLRILEIPQKPPMFCMLLRKYMEGAKINKILQPENERIIEFCFDSYNEIGERTPLILSIELMGKHSNIVLYNYDTNVILGCAHNVSPEKSRERELAGTLPYIYPPKQKKQNLLNISKEEFFNLSKIINLPFNEWLNNNFFDISMALANEICIYFKIETKNVTDQVQQSFQRHSELVSESHNYEMLKQVQHDVRVLENADLLPKKDTVTSISQEKIYKTYDKLSETLKLNNLNPCISKDAKIYSLISLSDDNWDCFNSVNEMVDIYFGTHIYANKILKIKTELFSAVNKELKRIKNNMKKLNTSIDNTEKAEKYRHIADTIMANLYNIKDRAKEFSTTNVHTGEKFLISLEETLSANENAQKYYKLYNKAKSAALISQKLYTELQTEKDYIESINYSIEQSENVNELTQIKEELSTLKLIKVHDIKQKNKEKKEIELECQEIDGFKIYIGKNNKQNDYIVSKFSSQNDIWLHAQEIPGSHVLIKVPPDATDISEQTIYNAAKIAAFYSQAKNALKVPVIYVKRKFLKKPPGARPGYVTYSNEKMFIVEQN